jgi:hypothetical protein
MPTPQALLAHSIASSLPGPLTRNIHPSLYSAPENQTTAGAGGYGGAQDDETAKALALNLFICDTADAVKQIVDSSVEAGELVLLPERGGEGRADDRVGASKRGREGSGSGAGRGSGGSRGVRSGKEAADEGGDRQGWNNADDDAYKRELGPERFKTIPLLEMVSEGKATFSLDVNGPQFTSPPKPIWSSSLAGQSLSHLLSQMSASAASGQLPANWMQGPPSEAAPGSAAAAQPPAFPLSLSPFVGVGGGLSASASSSGGGGGGSSSNSAGGAGGSASGSGAAAGGAKVTPPTVRGRMTRIGVSRMYLCVYIHTHTHTQSVSHKHTHTHTRTHTHTHTHTQRLK